MQKKKKNPPKNEKERERKIMHMMEERMLNLY